jgi:hypothetical protein
VQSQGTLAVMQLTKDKPLNKSPMITKTNFLIAFFFLILLTTKGQNQATVDNKSVIETKDGGILIFNNFNELELYFYIDYMGGQVKTTERNNLFEVSGTTLQVLALDKKEFVGKTNIETLENHAKSEIDYIADYLKVKLKFESTTIKINGQSDCLLWYYEMPESVSKEVKNQLYISFIYKDFIVGVNTAQFANQTFIQIQNFLKAIVENTHYSDERITLEYLCSKRNK